MMSRQRVNMAVSFVLKDHVLSGLYRLTFLRPTLNLVSNILKFEKKIVILNLVLFQIFKFLKQFMFIYKV